MRCGAVPSRAGGSPPWRDFHETRTRPGRYGLPRRRANCFGANHPADSSRNAAGDVATAADNAANDAAGAHDSANNAGAIDDAGADNAEHNANTEHDARADG